MAEDGGASSGAANSDSQQQQGGVQATLFTQDQLNSIAAKEKRGAIAGFFKELGFDEVPDAEAVKQTFAAAEEHKKLKDGEKGDVERLNGELNSAREKAAKVPELETVINRQRIAADEKVPSRFWKYIEGKSDDEIKESIKGLKEELGLTDDGNVDGQQQNPPAGTGARPPAPNQQQGSTSGGGAPGKTLSAGREAYEAKHKKATKE
jgi:hypothetical protein